MRTLLFVAVMIVAGTLAMVGPSRVAAEPSEHGACVQGIKDILVSQSSEGTVGDAISDVFYGNEPNVVDPFEGRDVGPSDLEPGTKAGRIVPSQSPGPKVTAGDGSVVPGSSLGDIHQQFCHGDGSV